MEGETNSARPFAYSLPPGRSRRLARIHSLRPATLSTSAVHSSSRPGAASTLCTPPHQVSCTLSSHSISWTHRPQTGATLPHLNLLSTSADGCMPTPGLRNYFQACYQDPAFEEAMAFSGMSAVTLVADGKVNDVMSEKGA